ncbi:MAG TPA: glycoside hydrolase N-terminal domain-containing protein, partial [Tichowtungia sp.]|nr:glycoside hydrolase N-terminal domain-containing protein [Tichowtungia sp.]
MKKVFQCLPILLSAIVLSAEAEHARSVIWDNAPAYQWHAAYPVGNGRLGAMPFGQFPHEQILINEETIWANGPALVMPENSFQYLEQIRTLEAAGDYAGADRTLERELLDSKEAYDYQLAGWLDLEYVNAAQWTDTVRELNLETGVARSVHTLSDGSTITQNVYASAVDDVIVVSVSSSTGIDIAISMDGGIVQDGDIVKAAAGEGENATQFISRIRALPADNVTPSGNTLEVQDAREITVYLSVATDFNREDSSAKLPDGWQNKALQDLDALTGKAAEQVEQDAIADHQSYFSRMDVDFGTTADAILALPTPDRLQRIKNGNDDDPDLIETYFQFGRYLLIASS